MKDINKREFEQLCTIGCSQKEFEIVLEVSIAEIDLWCFNTYGQTLKKIYNHFRVKGKVALKSYQWTAARNDPKIAANLEVKHDDIEVLAALLKPPQDGH